MKPEILLEITKRKPLLMLDSTLNPIKNQIYSSTWVKMNIIQNLIGIHPQAKSFKRNP